MENICKLIGGKGGGKETNAQATGAGDEETVAAALEVACEFARTKIAA